MFHYWFRDDLRLSDLPGLQAAGRGAVIPVYVLDEHPVNTGASAVPAAGGYTTVSLRCRMDSALKAAN